jgi:hypothetical protein
MRALLSVATIRPIIGLFFATSRFSGLTHPHLLSTAYALFKMSKFVVTNTRLPKEALLKYRLIALQEGMSFPAYVQMILNGSRRHHNIKSKAGLIQEEVSSSLSATWVLHIRRGYAKLP